MKKITHIFNKRRTKFFQFYLAIVLIFLGLSCMKSQINNGVGVIAGHLAASILSFFYFRIATIPLLFILRRIVSNPKHSIFGVNNKKMFEFLAFVFFIGTLFSVFFSTSVLMETAFFLFLASVDMAFLEKSKHE